ncbi:MAG: enoyl-CoA hydratase/isomerase family protein [Deltaproteobacteria bacterium]|nr:MAG: enoyl-CoA hydratase/isomerase family protein [Deltaproteobacteria bacterium]
MELSTLQYEKRDGAAIITLNRPERHNAINGAMSRELPRVWDDVKRDPAVVVAIVTGAGPRALCTGMDVADIASGTAQVGEAAERGSMQSIRLTALQTGCFKPVITAVNGMVCGGGLHFVADSDIVICSENATFFDTHVNVGLLGVYEPIGLTRRIPFEAVMRLSLAGSGDRMDAKRALDIGLVSEVTPQDGLLPRALELAREIMRNSPAALVATKRAIWESLNLSLDAALEHGWSAIEQHAGHPDIQEGARAFAEKRAPSWQGVSLEDTSR